MKNFLIGLVCGFLLTGLVAFILVFAAVRAAGSFAEARPTVADGSTLVLKLEGSIPEKPPTEVPIPFLEDQSPMSMQQVWEMFRKAAVDPKIKAIAFEPRALAAGWAQLQEVHAEIEQFRKSGKPVYTFLRTPGAREFYLATATDRIYMSPEDSLDLKGLLVQAMYFKNTLDKVGARFEVIHAGKYKDAYDTFSKTSMSPETRQVLNDVLDQYYGDLITVIAQGRKKDPAEIKALIDKGPFMAEDAKASGLVDALAYPDQAAGDLAKKLNQDDIKKLSHKAYLKVAPSAVGAEGGKRIAYIVGSGEILRGTGNSTFGEQEGIYSVPFTKILRDVSRDSTIRAAILRIDSPGGDSIASDDILHEVKNLSQKKPLIISMGDLAASGGYYISMSGDPIVAYPNTLTGSIGVIGGRLNIKGLYDKLGINVELLQRGRYAEIDSDYAPLTDDERQKIEHQVDQVYQAFLSRVSTGRKRPVGQIEELAQGRVWLGEQARKNGLVDELGGLDRALEMVKKRAGIAASEKVTLVSYPPKRTIFEMLASHQDETPMIDVQVRKLLGNLPVHSMLDGGTLKVMPFAIQVK